MLYQSQFSGFDNILYRLLFSGKGVWKVHRNAELFLQLCVSLKIILKSKALVLEYVYGVYKDMAQFGRRCGVTGRWLGPRPVLFVL